ncbi:ABC transporter substrate-binding protein [Actinotalea sp. M2MS4P-6]|uniref:ABC transporter substrate-binding protein n=1 Tax=Actinotalea sp. M2MS4P-6 TaxID=2983762 RepID=UPI0021E4A019|nr:ABC transporter substrate-binding protein [Actinotalea sp. M2MS4P-6]MCV2394846.1 ABC transporter substrate-binding protein [Actinotalea sp. M2MS4P-6]
MRVHRRYAGVLAGIAVAGLTLMGCSSGDSGGGDTATESTSGSATDTAGAATEVEVFTWWTSGGEKAGLDGLVSVLAEKYPNVEFINGAVAGGAGSAAKDLLQSRLQANDPPDTFQAHAGAELDDYIAAGQVEDISDLYTEFGLTDAFPADLLDLLTVDGAIYSVPANIHRANVVWANPSVIEAAGLDPTATYATMADWFTALDAVQASGKTALSIATTWTQVQLLETVLISDLGPDAYNGLWLGETDWTGADVTAALEDFQKLMSYTNTDRDGLDWPDALGMVTSGDAAFNVMGDWAAGELDAESLTAGTDYIYFPVPGTDGIFDFLADSFTLPVGAPHPDGAKAWLDVVGSLEGQTAFNKAKGSIPARTDADPMEFNEYQQSAIKDFGSDTIVPSLMHGAAAPIAQLNAISDATSKFTTGGSDLATFQSELAASAG